MREKRDLSFIEKAILNMHLKVGSLGLKPVYFGNHNSETLFNHFEISEYLDSFGYGVDFYTDKEFNSIIIYGEVNFVQLAILKHFIEENSDHIGIIIRLSGAMNEKLRSKSSVLIKDLSEEIHIDIEYNKYPIDFEELSELIREKQRERLSS